MHFQSLCSRKVRLIITLKLSKTGGANNAIFRISNIIILGNKTTHTQEKKINKAAKYSKEKVGGE